MSKPRLDLCEPRTELCPACGQYHTYHCGRLLLRHDPIDPEQVCPDGTMLCVHCADEVGEFLQKAYEARAVRQEWDGG
jgi:hypothetical protein